MVRRLLLLFLTLVGRVFFRRIEVRGRDRMPDGPVILIGNHPNSLLDPMVTVGVLISYLVVTLVVFFGLPFPRNVLASIPSS